VLQTFGSDWSREQQAPAFYKHSAPLEPGAAGPRFYKHSAPLEPGAAGASVLQTFGSDWSREQQAPAFYKHSAPLEPEAAGPGFYKHSAPLEPGTEAPTCQFIFSSAEIRPIRPIRVLFRRANVLTFHPRKSC